MKLQIGKMGGGAKAALASKLISCICFMAWGGVLVYDCTLVLHMCVLDLCFYDVAEK